MTNWKEYIDNFFNLLNVEFQKKTQKTPKIELEKALKLMAKYYSEKTK